MNPKRIKEIRLKSLLYQHASDHPTYGFRRLYCAFGLNLKCKPKKRLARRTAVKLEVPCLPNKTWSIDLDGRRFRTMNVIDDYRRECLGIKVGFSLPSKFAKRHLDEIAVHRGYPDIIKLDNAPEHISHHFAQSANRHAITLRFIQPVNPSQNAYIEGFNRTY